MIDFRPSVLTANSEDERRSIYAFRYKVYIEEMGKPYANADHLNRLLGDELDDCGTVLYVQNAGQIIGTVRINWGCDEKVVDYYRERFSLEHFRPFPIESFSFCSRLMVAREYRNTRLALNLSEVTYRKGRERGVQFSFLSCKPELAPFFQRLGCLRYKCDFHDPNSGLQIAFVQILQDIEFLRSIKSPFYKESVKWENSPETRKWFDSNASIFSAHKSERIPTESVNQQTNI